MRGGGGVVYGPERRERLGERCVISDVERVITMRRRRVYRYLCEEYTVLHDVAGTGRWGAGGGGLLAVVGP